MQVYNDLEYYLGQGHDTQGHGYQFMAYHYPIDVTSEILAWTKKFQLMHCNLYLEIVKLCQGHNLPLDHVQELHGVSSPFQLSSK